MLSSWWCGRLFRLLGFLLFSAAIVAVASLAHQYLLVTLGFGSNEYWALAEIGSQHTASHNCLGVAERADS